MAPNAIYWAWLYGTMEVLVPSRNKKRWLRAPAWHSGTKRTYAIEDAAGCDVFGLDGTLSFQCGTDISVYRDRRHEFEQRILPVISKEFFAPIGAEVGFDLIADELKKK